MAKRATLYPGQLDTNANHFPQEGLEVDRQPEDRFSSDAWDLIESALLALERQLPGIRSATLVVAASDSGVLSIAQADYVCDGVADDVQIQTAINALPAVGGSVILMEGHYNSIARITGRSNLALLGNKAVITSTADYCFYAVDVSNLEIAGFEIDHSGGTAGTSSAILIESVDALCRNIKIHDNEIYDSLRAGIHINIRLLAPGVGPTYGFDGVYIERNYVHDLTAGTRGPDGNGIQVGRGYMDNVRILNNTVEHMLSVGIFVGSDVGYGTFHDVKIENNHILNAPNYGIDISGLVDSVISRNYIYNDDAHVDVLTKGIFIEAAAIMPSHDVTIERNVCDGSGLDAIEVSHDNDYFDLLYNVTRRVLNPTAGGAIHIAAPGEHNKAMGNRICGALDGAPTSGIYLGDYAQICYNHIHDITQHGIYHLYTGGLIGGNTIISPVQHGIALLNATSNVIIANYFNNVGFDGIHEWGTANNNLIVENNVQDCAPGGMIVISGANTIVRENIGFVTENSGTDTIAAANTAVVIAHGLAVTPTVDDIHITLAENPTNDIGLIWVDTIGAVNFTVNCRAVPGASALDFGWQAIVL